MSPTEDKTDDVKDSFYGELQHEFDKFPKHYMNILLGDFNSKVGRVDIFKQSTVNESLYGLTDDNGARAVNFAICKNLSQKYIVSASQHS
jgi:hypothetical protein